MMKLVFITVSAPALKFLPLAVKELNNKVEGSFEVKVYYCIPEFTPERLSKMTSDISEADVTFLDLMGASTYNLPAINDGCIKTKGHVIAYGASSRKYMRLGAFSGTSIQAEENKKAPSPEAIKKMASMAKTVGKFLPGKMKDMRNYVLLCSYFKHASQENFENMLNLLGTEYGGVKGLPKIKPPIEPPPIAIYDLSNMVAYDDFTSFRKAKGFDESKPNVAIHFTAHAYPTDTSGCIRAIEESLSDFCNVYPIGTSGFFSDYGQKLKNYLLDVDCNISLYLDCTPFRLSAGPMGGDVEYGVNILKQMNVPYLHPMFLTRQTKTTWEQSVSGCSPNEILLSIMLPEMDGATEIIPVATMGEMKQNEDTEQENCELEIIGERLTRLTERVKNHLYLRQTDNCKKRVAIICYNYPPGEANLFGGAFLDTFASVSAILSDLKNEGYQTDALSAEELMDIFTEGKAVNSGKYDCNWQDIIKWDYKEYEAASEITSAWGKAPGHIMTEANSFLIPGTVKGNVFIGLQPARGSSFDSEKSYHDKSLAPHHQYAAFYQWLRNVFRADAIIHVGTHGTIEFLPGKEAGLSGKCWPDRLISDIPHIYLYYCGNPAESIVAKRRTYANIVSYQPPVFVTGDLYGEWLELETAMEDYQHLKAVSPNSAEAAKKIVEEKALALGLSDDMEEIESELYRMSKSLIPKGLHVFGTSYTDEEVGQYAKGIAMLRSAGKEPGKDIIAKSKLESEAAINNHESEGLLDALEGKFNLPKLAGDIFRSPEVLPSGYNLYQFDARQVPSEAAVLRGSKIAENTINAYFEQNKCYPQSVAVVCWGLETSRTQGETIGQILAYLGVRNAKGTSIWDHKYELIPLEELSRPRIDVIVNICGFFRDMFPNLINYMDDIFNMLFDADEPYDMNYFRAHSKDRYYKLIKSGYDEKNARELAISRIFGPKEGEYGSGLNKVIEQKNWKLEEELGQHFTESLHYIYSRRSSGRKEKELYRENLSCVEVISQLRSNNEYEITDLDHYYEYFGGLSKSVEMVKGKKAAMYITDVTGGQIHTETVDKSIARGLRTRVLNPKWIGGMLEHKYHGTQEIAKRFENVMGLAATTGAVDSRFYDDMEACYVKDEERKRQMKENNPYAYMNILEQMLEYHSRGYWNASEEQLNRIKQTYLSLEESIESKQ